MLSLGQDYPFGFPQIADEDQLRAIRAAGFDAVMIHWEERNGRDACRQLDDIAHVGLRVLTAHFPQECMADMWREGPAGDALTDAIVAALREAAGQGIRHMVLHTTRRLGTPEPNETGLARFGRVAEAGEKYGIDAAIENTRFLRYNQYLFDRISSPRLRFCFDCGHANCFTPEADPLAMFGPLVATTHLHDNHGGKDEHMLIGEGAIDLDRVFSRLAALGVEEYNLESRYRPLPGESGWTLEEYLQKAYSRLSGHVQKATRDFNAMEGVEK